MRIRGAKLVARALADEGVRYTFGIPGTHTLELFDALESAPGIEPVLVTSELAGAFMADGMARTTGRPGVLTVVPGAGVTHALSGIAEAYLDQVPLVVIACGVRADTGAAFQLHDIDQVAVLRPVCKEVLRVEGAEAIYGSVRRAFEIARGGVPGPVAVHVAADLMMLVQDVTAPAWAPAPSQRPLIDRAQLERAAWFLGRAEHPALYLGRGATGAAERWVALAEQLGAPVTTTLQGKGVFPEHHPLWLWNGFGAQAPPFVRRIMDRCDCLLAVGCRFGEVATGSYGIEPPPVLIHVDLDPGVFDRNVRATLAMQADASDFARGLEGLIEGGRPWRALSAEIGEGHRRVRETWRRQGSSKVSAQALFTSLQRHCGRDAVFVTDSGNGTFLAVEHLRLERPGCFIGPIDFSAMGYAVPGSIGAALAHPGRDVVALAGDGALLMTGLELLTAAAYRAAPLVVVLRDGLLGQIAQFQRVPLGRTTCTVLPDYRLEDLARCVSASYYRIAAEHELDSVLPAALAQSRAGKPTVVEVGIDGLQRTYFTRGVLATNFWRLSWRDRLAIVGRAISRHLL